MRIRPFNFVVLSSILAIVFTASAQQPAAPDYPDRSALLVVRDAAGGEQAIKTAEDWATRRGHILAGMQAAMGPLPDRAKFPPLDVQISESTDEEGYRRVRIAFAGDEKDRVPAYLLMPLGPRREQRLPAMLALHQTIGIGKGEVVGLGGSANLHYGRELAQRGYVVLAPDYPSFGDYRYDFQHSALRLGHDEGDRQSHACRGCARCAARGRSGADRRHRPLAGRPQRDVCRRVRPAAEGDRLQLRLDAVPRLLRRQDRRLDQRPLHAAAAERVRIESGPRAVRFLRSRGGAGPARVLFQLAAERRAISPSPA